MQIVLWKIVQQSELDLRVQEQRGVRDQQEEQDGVQGVQTEEMPSRGDVEERISLWEEIELVQDSLSAAGAAATAAASVGRRWTAHGEAAAEDAATASPDFRLGVAQSELPSAAAASAEDQGGVDAVGSR